MVAANGVAEAFESFTKTFESFRQRVADDHRHTGTGRFAGCVDWPVGWLLCARALPGCRPDPSVMVMRAYHNTHCACGVIFHHPLLGDLP